MASNTLSLYRKITKKIIKLAGIKNNLPQLFYTDLEEKTLQIKMTDSVIEIDDGNWSPTDNNLIYQQEFIIEHPNELFGKAKVTDCSNKIGMAAHIYSKNSLFQETITLPVDIVNDTERVKFDFRHTFKPGSLRGCLCIDFFMYLKELNSRQSFQADRIGMILCQEDLYKARIVIDGEGVMFPIIEYKDSNGPLWTIERNWHDPSVDEFDVTNVRIKLNTANPLSKQVFNSNGRMANEIMSTIMVQSIAMITYETILDMQRYYGGMNKVEAMEGSILEVVNTWIIEYSIDTSNMMTIVDSLQNGELYAKLQLRGTTDD